MSREVLRLSALCSVFALVAGCGGSSGGSSNAGGGGGGTPTAVTLRFTVGTPAALAARIGSGAFTAQTLSSGSLSLSIPSGTTTFSVAYACTLVSGTINLPEQFVYEMSTADGTAFTLPCPTSQSTGQTGILTGNIDASGISGATESDIATANSALTTVSGVALNGSFSVSAPAGSDRVEVLAYNVVQQGFVRPVSLLAARNFASQPVPGALNGGNAVILGAADQTTSQSIAYNNVPSGYAAPTTSVGLAMGGSGGFTVGGSLTNQYPALPAGALQSGDVYEFTASASNSSKATEAAYVLQNSSSGGPMTLTFPPAWAFAGPTPAALPTFNVAYSGFSGKSGVSESASLGWFTGASTEIFYQVSATANYLDSSTSLVFPDLSGLTGFVASPSSGTVVSWTAVLLQESAGILQANSANSTGVAVVNSGSYTVP
ncbi:MAG: hypothetical protein WCA10_22330 [Terracidiphilus sp.]